MECNWERLSNQTSQSHCHDHVDNSCKEDEWVSWLHCSFTSSVSVAAVDCLRPLLLPGLAEMQDSWKGQASGNLQKELRVLMAIQETARCLVTSAVGETLDSPLCSFASDKSGLVPLLSHFHEQERWHLLFAGLYFSLQRKPGRIFF